MSNPKKKTPLQEAIKSLESMREGAILPAFKSGISASIERLLMFLPKEKQFAEEMFDAGDRRGYSLNSKIDNDTKASIPTFTELYKQYEP